MACVGFLAQKIFDSSYKPRLAITSYPNLACDPVCSAEAHTPDLICKPVRVIPHYLHCIVAVSFVDLNGKGGSKTPPLQCYHYFFNVPMGRKSFFDLLSLGFTNAGDLQEPLRLLLDHL